MVSSSVFFNLFRFFCLWPLQMQNTREREREWETDRQTDRQTETERKNTEKWRERERQTDRQIETDRQTDRQTDRDVVADVTGIVQRQFLISLLLCSLRPRLDSLRCLVEMNTFPYCPRLPVHNYCLNGFDACRTLWYCAVQLHYCCGCYCCSCSCSCSFYFPLPPSPSPPSSFQFTFNIIGCWTNINGLTFPVSWREKTMV